MSDQGTDVSGVSPQATTDPTLMLGGSPAASPSFGASPSMIAASAPPAGGGGAVGAPGAGAPAASPAGFDLSAMSPQSVAELQSPNPAQTAITSGVLSAPDPNAPAATPGGGTAGGGQPTNSVLNAIQNPGINSILNAVGGNLGPLASLGILGFEAANKPGGVGGGQLPAGAQPGPTAGALVSTAEGLKAQGQQLSQPLATGALPPGAQAAVDQVTQEQEAQIRQQFATMGLTGSTMEASAIANARQAAQARGFAIAQQMAQQGLSDLSLSSNIFSELLQSGLQSDQEFQQALTQFAASLAGGSGGGQTIRLSAA